MMNNKDCWILTLNLLFERATSLIHRKDKQITKFLDKNIGSMDCEELETFMEEIDSQIEEICKLIEYIYEYKYKRKNPFENYIPTTESQQ